MTNKERLEANNAKIEEITKIRRAQLSPISILLTVYSPSI